MDLKITTGISTQQINELINFSNTDDLVLKTTNDQNRFKDLDAVEAWLKKKRTIYTLTDDSGKLFGILWFGNKSVPNIFNLNTDIKKSNYGTTFAIRIYEKARGKGFAKFFIKESFKRYAKTDEYINNSIKGMWLESNVNNLPAISLYKSIGFEEAGKSKDGRVLMIAQRPKIKT